MSDPEPVEVTVHHHTDGSPGWSYYVLAHVRGLGAPLALCRTPRRAEIVADALRLRARADPDFSGRVWATHDAEVDLAAPDETARGMAYELLYALDLAQAGEIETGRAVDAVRLIPALREALDRAEADLLDVLKGDGASWGEIADVAYEGRYSRQALALRYRRLGGEGEWPSGRRRGHRW